MDAREAKRILESAKQIQLLCPSPCRKRISDPKELFDQLVTEVELINCCRQLFMDGHYARAVEEAYKCLNNFIKDRTKSSEDGSSLMQSVFSPNSPKLKINRFRSQSHRDEQLGYMQIYAGCMTGIRNPRVHEHTYKDEPDEALELITLANHLMRRARLATRTRRDSDRNYTRESQGKGGFAKWN